MKPVLVFDLNETLLDMSSLDRTFGQIFGTDDGSTIRKQWFHKVLELFLTATVVAEYRSFDKLTDDALQVIALQRGAEASADDRAALKSAQEKISAYADVRPGLERLGEAGFTVATLTNSTKHAATKLLEHAGLEDSLDSVLSADSVERYKPAREAYEYAARELDVKPGGILLVAAHAWDIAGARAAGCKAAFIARPEKALSPGTPQPQFRARDIVDLAGQLVSKFT